MDVRAAQAVYDFIETKDTTFAPAVRSAVRVIEDILDQEG